MNAQSRVLEANLVDYYAKHGVHGVEEYIAQGKSVGENERSTSTIVTKENINQIDNCGSRFIRLNPRFDTEETLQILKSEMKLQSKEFNYYVKAVPWLSNKLLFYALPSCFPLNSSHAFQSGRVYGMDVSSGAAVAALLLNEHDDEVNRDFGKAEIRKEEAKGDSDNVTLVVKEVENGDDGQSGKALLHKKGDFSCPSSSPSLPNPQFRVLDLCCAPGLKTCAIADLLEQQQRRRRQQLSFSTTKPQQNTVIGVDISKHRMHLCRSIIKKYHTDPETCSSSSHKITMTGDSTSDNCRNTVSNSPNRPSSPPTLPIESTSTHIQLYCADGTVFGTTKQKLDASSCLLFDSDTSKHEQRLAGKRKRMNKSARAREKKRLREIASQEFSAGDSKNDKCGNSESQNSYTAALKTEENTDYSICIPLFDRVLVDAECSTDGSIRHMQEKYKRRSKESNIENKSMETTNEQITDRDKLRELVELQKRLIESGFRLLKPGGIMVYATCSLSKEQNEEVITWLLNSTKKAFLIPISFSGETNKKKDGKEDEKEMMISKGFLPGTVRFQPNTNFPLSSTVEEKKISMYGGGFFIAKIGKVSN